MQESGFISELQNENKKTNYKPKPSARVASSSCYHFGFLTQKKEMSKEILLVWQGYNEKSTGTFVDIEERTVVYLDTEPVWAQLQKDVETYKHRIRVLENLNTKYRKKLGISNETIDALGLIYPLDDVAQAE